MADKYTKATWTDRLVQYPVRYTLDRVAGPGIFEDGDQVDMVVTPGIIIAEGTDVLQTYLNNAEDGIESANNPSRSSESVIYNEVNSLGSDIYDGELQGESIGRSDANLLDDDVAGCESTSGIATSYGSVGLDNSDFVEGSNSVEFTASVVATVGWRTNSSVPIDNTKYYLATAYLKNVDGTSVELRVVQGGGFTAVKTSSSVSSDVWTRVGVALNPTELSGITSLDFYTRFTADDASDTCKTDAIMLNEITAEDYNSLSDPTDASDLFDKYPYHRGLVGSGVGRVKSVGKNLFDKDTNKLELGTIGTDGNNDTSTTRCRTPKFIKVGHNILDYIASVEGSNYAVRSVYYYDNFKNFISFETIDSTAFDIPSNCNYIKFILREISNITLTQEIIDTLNDTFMLQEGTAATTYEPYKSSQVYNNRELYSVPRGTHCTKNLNTGKYVKRVARYVLESGDMTGYVTSPTNVDYVIISKPTDYINYNIDSTNTGTTISSIWSDGSVSDNTTAIGNLGSYTATTFGYVVAKGTYADLAATQTALAGTVIHYELDPAYYETHYDQPQILQAFPNGTIYNEFAICEQLTYTDSKITITDTDYPISSLDYVYKVEYETDGEIIKTPIDISDCTVASDGLTFTITDAVDGEKYEFAYYYFGVSVLPAIEYTTADSTKEQINNNSEQIVRVNEKINDVNSKVSQIFTVSGIVTSLSEVTASSTETQEIEIGISATHGKIMIGGIGGEPSSSVRGAIINFTTTENDCSAFSYFNDFSFDRQFMSFLNKGVDGTVVYGETLDSGNYIDIESIYIEGTKIKIKITNSHTSNVTPLLGFLYWEVYR